MAISDNLTTESYSTVAEQVVCYGKLQGAGAAAPVVPTTTISTTSSKSFMQRSTNFVSITAADTTRSGAGVYTTKFRQLPAIVIDVGVNIMGPNGLWALCLDVNVSTRTISFSTFNAGGTPTDMAATDFITFTVTGQNSPATY